MRLLELEILRALNKSGQRVIDVRDIIWLDVDMMCGIEYEEFPARIAEVAMWLIDHQMNMQISNEFGQYFVRLPLKKAAKIVHGDALKTDWQSLLNPVNEINVVAKHANIYLVEEPQTEYKNVNIQTETFEIYRGKVPKEKIKIKFDFILGNPPFIGKKEQTQGQKAEMEMLFAGVNGSGVLDYVTAWYLKAAQYIQNEKTKVAFVSTNSIVQGEQVGILWSLLFNRYNIHIHFAHRTFKWSNEAKGNAAVYCVIIGFAGYDTPNKSIFEYEDIRGEAHEIKSKSINPYLIDAKNVFILKRTLPLCKIPKMLEGITPLDNGILSFSESEYLEFIKQEPASIKWFKPWITGDSFINRYKMYCLWLTNIKPEEIRSMPLLSKKIKQVKEFRENSKSSQKFAATPWLFRETTIAKHYILVPKTSSENRKYIPIGFIEDAITSSSSLMINDANIYHFGILTSLMHMTWVKSVCGRLESRYRYSKDIVYNNYPWPDNPNEKQIKAIETAAQKVLDARLQFPNSSLADLYDPLTMPPTLVKAHNELDKAVDLAYRPQAFTSEANRMVFLFELYEKYTADLFTKEKPKKPNKKKES